MNASFVRILAAAVVFATVGATVACGDDDDGSSATSTPAAAGTTRTLESVLTEAINEEYKARATYQAVIDKLGDVGPFKNILASENQHVDAWKAQFEANKLTVPSDGFAGKVSAPADLKAACAIGVAAEKEDVALYDRLMKETTDDAVLKVMTAQRKVSQENHLPAFERCA